MKTQLRKVVASSTPTALSAPPDPWHQIALAAYFKAEARGSCPGHELDDWLEAERELGPEAVGEELAA
ncbi:MAG: DUF2934 domain-containing protein [Thiobacillaceae bacterium]